MRFRDRLLAAWYAPRITLLAAALWPLSLLYGVAASLRRFGYRQGILTRTRLSVPVIVIGNLTVGGTGKTPLVRALAAALAARGFHPGIVSRGYGGRVEGPRVLTETDPPEEIGDEPAMLARDGFPVAVAPRRADAGRSLLAVHPDVDVIVADDGLQHYALERDVEIAVVDAARGFGNGLLLPAGPLRESVARLTEVDAIVYREEIGRSPPECGQRPSFAFTVEVLPVRNLVALEAIAQFDKLPAGSVHAVAGIGDPQRFFARLRALGLDPICHAFADHHAYVPADIEFPGARAIVMTEKDAVKCRVFADERMWQLPIRARIDPALVTLVEDRIRGSKAA
jgi:tetraacyldisaccharide 4'-kinase